jgi:hypothetical protein
MVIIVKKKRGKEETLASLASKGVKNLYGLPPDSRVPLVLRQYLLYFQVDNEDRYFLGDTSPRVREVTSVGKEGGVCSMAAPPAGLASPSRPCAVGTAASHSWPRRPVPGDQNQETGTGIGADPGVCSRGSSSRTRAWRHTFFLLAAARGCPRTSVGQSPALALAASPYALRCTTSRGHLPVA